MSFPISEVYLATILAAILNFSKCSMIPARHHADPHSTWLPLPKSAKTCCGGIFARLPRFVASGNQTNIKWPKDHQNQARVCRKRFILESPWSWQPSWTPYWIGKMPKFKLNLPSRFCMSHRYSYKSHRLFQSINAIFCHFHEDFYWWVTPKSFIIEISLWYMLVMVPNIFSLNPEHRKIYEKTQRSQPSLKGLRKEVHHCESLKLADILDFEKCSRVRSIHQADFVYVMSEAAESSEKKTISVGSGYAHLAAWLKRPFGKHWLRTGR